MNDQTIRHLVIVLGDQLDEASSAFDDFDPSTDVIWMAEVMEESTHVWSSKQRTTLFLSAMRHFAHNLRLQQSGGTAWRVDYTALDDVDNTGTLAGELARAVQRHQPAKLVLTAPGDWRVLQALRSVASTAGLELELRDDRHFFSTVRDFAAHAKGRKQLRLEYFYRELRHKTGLLMEGADPKKQTPVGGQWNFDADNREAFGKAGPVDVPQPTRFAPDEITQAVIDLVNTRLAAHPGVVSKSAAGFGWPVTRSHALEALKAFIDQRLPLFGQYEDAMWEGEAWLYHSHLSSSLNLKLVNPREVLDAAQAAYQRGHAPLAAVEGFIRQILGWREYVRGIYWTQMPAYLELNAQSASQPLPAFYWTGKNQKAEPLEMKCLSDAIGQTLEHGYAHHIQRLMVTGLYALLFGVHPKAVHEWYLAVYVDAVEWVELPNTLGMSQFGDGGIMASKPYIASGKYIQRMSNHCKGCQYDSGLSTGDTACPFTTLYWDYMIQHEAMLSKNPRMGMQLKNLGRLSAEQRSAIAAQAANHRSAVQSHHTSSL
jgi:deoxyribodipyrimidine photolyase-related protein